MKKSSKFLKTFAIFTFSIFAINSVVYADNSDTEDDEKKPIQIENIIYDAKFSETNKIFVTPNGAASKDGKSWKNATTLNAALQNAQEFQTILVAKGSYFADSTKKNADLSFILKNNVRIYGGFDEKTGLRFSDSSIIDGQLNDDTNTIQLIYGENLSENTVLDGFLIQNGIGVADTSKGGAMFLKNSNPKLQNLTFQRNEAKFGAAIYNQKSNPVIKNVYFSANNAPIGDPTPEGEDGAGGFGGAIYNYESSPKIIDAVFDSNYALIGAGAIYNEKNSSPTIINAVFEMNNAQEGGAIYNENNSNPTISNTVFDTNSGQFSGGAIFNKKANPVINNCKFTSNDAGDNGGAIYNEHSNITINNSLFEANNAEVGGAIHNELDSNSLINNSTFIDNIVNGDVGGAICNTSSGATINNSIFWENSVNFKVETKAMGEVLLGETLFSYGSNKDAKNSQKIIIKNSILPQNSVHIIGDDSSIESSVAYKFMQGENGSKGNKTVDPKFVDAENGNYKLKKGSPAINAGDDSLYPVTMASDKDLDGKPRKVGKIDIGAYEFQN